MAIEATKRVTTTKGSTRDTESCSGDWEEGSYRSSTTAVGRTGIRNENPLRYGENGTDYRESAREKRVIVPQARVYRRSGKNVLELPKPWGWQGDRVAGVAPFGTSGLTSHHRRRSRIRHNARLELFASTIMY